MFNKQDVVAPAKPTAVAAAMEVIQKCRESFDEIKEEIEKAEKYNGISFPFRAEILRKLSDGLEILQEYFDAVDTYSATEKKCVQT